MRGVLLLLKKLSLLCFYCSIAVAQDPFNEAIQHKRSLQRLDQCFCELQGPVDECCCDVETVDSLNSEKIYPLISSLVQYSYFKFYQVNLNQPCPFWTDDGHCALKSCSVEECAENDVPLSLKLCDQEQEQSLRLSTVNRTVSLEQQQHFKMWEEFDDNEESFCEADGDSLDEMSYVDLLLNPERFTGYSGHSAIRIWRSIYQENCFRPKEVLHSPASLPYESSLIQGMCLEKRAFFRIISGMHSSINVHLSAIYLISGGTATDSTFGPNLNEFVRRFDAATTNGQGPSWLKNLYFAYLLVLRAITKTESYWNTHQFYTGNHIDDDAVNEKVQQIITAAKGCSSSLFDENMMFTGNTSQQLKSAFRDRFKNITRIMDCVGCSKCKLWGKLQVQGIGTALKILFSKRKTGHLILTRREVVALFNVLGRFSSSIHFLQVFRKMEAKRS